ncbi:MAG: AsmA family protein [Nitratireductor sp.]
MVVVALFSALIAPHFVDWTAHKEKFEIQASEILGQPVKVEGDASVILLPTPSVRFGSMKVGENEDGSPLLYADEFSANIEIIPFLSGEVRVVELTLDKPILNLHVNDDGTIKWTNRESASTNDFVDFDQVKLDKVNISNAQINIKGLAGGRDFFGENINGTMSAKSLLGPWNLEALGDVEGVQTKFEISTGRLQNEGNLRVKLAAQRIDQPYKILLDGPLGIEDEILSWNGKFKISPVIANSKITSQFLTNDTKEPLNVRTEGLFSLTPAALNVSEFRTEIGDKIDPFVLEGQGSASLQDEVYFRFNIDGRQINLDRVAQMRGEETSENATQTSFDRIRIIREVIEQIPVPSVAGELDFEVPAIIAGDSIVREVSANIRPKGDGWDIRKLRAKMPGSSTLEAEGRLGLFEDFGFSGHMVLATKQPSGLASWAVGRVDPAIRGLSSAGVEADVTFTQSQTSFANMILFLGNNQLKGNVQRIAGFDGNGDASKVSRPAIIAMLEGEEIKLDDLKAVLAFTGQDENAKINDHDLDVNLLAKRFEAFDVVAENVDLQFQLASGELSIGKLNAGSFYGASLSSVGQISDLLGKPKGNIKFDLLAKNADQFVGFVQERLGDHFILDALQKDNAYTQDTKLSVEIDASPSGEGSRGRLIAKGAIGGTDINALLSFDASIESINDAQMDLSVNLENASPNVLLGQSGVLINANKSDAMQLREALEGSPQMQGPIQMSVESVGTLNAGLSTLVSATTPQASLSANGLYTPKPNAGEPLAEMDLVIGFENVEPYLLAFGYDVNHSLSSANDLLLGQSASIPLSLKTKLRLADKKAQASNIIASVSGNDIQGSLNWQKKSNGNALLEGDLMIGQLSVPKVASVVFGKNGNGGLNAQAQNANSSNENDLWSTQEFGLPLLSGIDANINLEAGSLYAGSKFEAKNAKMVMALRDGNIALKDIIGESESGTFSGDLSLQNANGTGVLKSFFQVDGLIASNEFAKFGLPDFLQGSLTLNGALEGSGKTALAMVSSLSGSGVVSIKDGLLKGVNVDGLKGVLAVSDSEEFEINADNVNPLIEANFLNGQLKVGDETIAYAISRGVVQVRNLIVEGDNWQSAMDAQMSIANQSVEANMRLGVDGGKDAVAGVSPEIDLAFNGLLNLDGASNITRSINSQTMQGFLSVRALEAEERRVELLQASILEKQRYRFEDLKSNTKNQYVEFQRQEVERLEVERLENIRLEKERLEKERLEKERLEKERLEKERLENERLEKLRKEREEAQLQEAKRQEALKAEAARKAAEAKRIADEKRAEAARKVADEEAIRLANEQNNANDEIEILKPLEIAPSPSGEKKKPRFLSPELEKSAIDLLFPETKF